MEPAEKIFAILAIAALIAVLCVEHKRIPFATDIETARLPDDRLNASVQPTFADIGPVYLVAALPDLRRYDDAVPLASRELLGDGTS